MKKTNGVIWKRFPVFILLVLLISLLLTLPVCAPWGGPTQATNVRETWTPESHPKDQPYQIQTETLSYFGDTPVLVIFGSQDPEDDSPLQAINISTEDDYDLSIISPAPVSTWSRPIVSGNKEVYFQVRGVLYILSPGGQTRSIELPYDEQNPAYCNWSWKGQLVCLNNMMTSGFLVNQDLSVMEMRLPADDESDPAEYYEPYRVGDNGIRIIQTTTKTLNGRETVTFKDLDLETQTVQSQRIRIEKDFDLVIYWSKDSNELNTVQCTREEGNLDVLGMTDDGNKVSYFSLATCDKVGLKKTMSWVETYDVSTLGLVHNLFSANLDVTKKHYRNYVIIGWPLDEENKISEQPMVFNLEAGIQLEGFSGFQSGYEVFDFILPYEKAWIAIDSLGLSYHIRSGDLVFTNYFPEDIVESMSPDSFLTVTQPIEP